MKNKINYLIKGHISVFENLNEEYYNNVIRLYEKILESINSGGIIYLFGNGGSASDSQHIAAEFTGRFVKERKGLPAISLNTDTSALTAIGNDYGYENVFSRQIESLVKPNDTLIGISTSGNSKNVINGLEKGKEIGACVASFTGNTGGIIKALSDININIESNITARIQEAHIFTGHAICEMIDDEF